MKLELRNEVTLDSREVAKMIEKEHSNLLKDIGRYSGYFNEVKINLVDFFQESQYLDNKGEKRKCYNITKKGCEFLAHKLTGRKGAIFTARYIEIFHKMEKELKEQEQLRLPLNEDNRIGFKTMKDIYSAKDKVEKALNEYKFNLMTNKAMIENSLLEIKNSGFKTNKMRIYFDGTGYNIMRSFIETE